MARYLVSRMVQSVVTLFFIALIAFLLMHSVPGGPFQALAGERAVSEEFVRAQESYYGLSDPLPVQSTISRTSCRATWDSPSRRRGRP